MHIITIRLIVCSVKPEDRPRIVAPLVAITMEEPLQLADSLANHPVRIDQFKVNQVSFSCELATALHIILLHYMLCCILAVKCLSVQCAIWDVDAHILFVLIRELVLEVIHELIYVCTFVSLGVCM